MNFDYSNTKINKTITVKALTVLIIAFMLTTIAGFNRSITIDVECIELVKPLIIKEFCRCKDVCNWFFFAKTRN